MQILFAIAMIAVSFVITALMTPKSKPPAPAALNDFSFPQDAENTPQAVVFGDVWSDGWFVIWFGNLRSEAIKASGGK